MLPSLFVFQDAAFDGAIMQMSPTFLNVDIGSESFQAWPQTSRPTVYEEPSVTIVVSDVKYSISPLIRLMVNGELKYGNPYIRAKTTIIL